MWSRKGTGSYEKLQERYKKRKGLSVGRVGDGEKYFGSLYFTQGVPFLTSMMVIFIISAIPLRAFSSKRIF